MCHKELRESRRWLRLIQRVPLLKPAPVQSLVGETEELIRIRADGVSPHRETERARGAVNIEHSTLNV